MQKKYISFNIQVEDFKANYKEDFKEFVSELHAIKLKLNNQKEKTTQKNNVSLTKQVEDFKANYKENLKLSKNLVFREFVSELKNFDQFNVETSKQLPFYFYKILMLNKTPFDEEVASKFLDTTFKSYTYKILLKKILKLNFKQIQFLKEETLKYYNHN